MAELATSIDNRLAVLNDWQFAHLFREVKGISKDACLAITDIVGTLGAIGIVAFNTGLSAVLVWDVVSWLALWAIVVVGTDLTVFNAAVFALFSSHEHLTSNTTVVIGISRDISESSKSPICAPWVLNDPLSLGITD